MRANCKPEDRSVRQICKCIGHSGNHNSSNNKYKGKGISINKKLVEFENQGIQRVLAYFPSYNAECGPVFGSYCQKKQTEHSIRPVSSALFGYRYDSFKAERVQTRLGHIGLYARRPVRYVPLTATHCRLRLTWSREHVL
ncbi:transposable element Tcb1 transposase [Trichonephila clavipes]|nr:transposable element Tcb1 transposase [Trichonephila clavipes]